MYNIKCKDCMLIFEHKARNKRYCDHCNHIRKKEIWDRNNAITKTPFQKRPQFQLYQKACHPRPSP